MPALSIPKRNGTCPNLAWFGGSRTQSHQEARQLWNPAFPMDSSEYVEAFEVSIRSNWQMFCHIQNPDVIALVSHEIVGSLTYARTKRPEGTERRSS